LSLLRIFVEIEGSQVDLLISMDCSTRVDTRARKFSSLEIKEPARTNSSTVFSNFNSMKTSREPNPL